MWWKDAPSELGHLGLRHTAESQSSGFDGLRRFLRQAVLTLNYTNHIFFNPFLYSY